MLRPRSPSQYGSRALTQTLTRKQIHAPAALPSFSPKIQLAGLNPCPLAHTQIHVPAPSTLSPTGSSPATTSVTANPTPLVLRQPSLPQAGGSPAMTSVSQPNPYTWCSAHFLSRSMARRPQLKPALTQPPSSPERSQMTPAPPPATRSRSWTAPPPTSSLLRILTHPNNRDVNTASPLTPAAR